jgi:MarR family transcriptional regulator, lower aerobic nicotinate degradation pathway regulator
VERIQMDDQSLRRHRHVLATPGHLLRRCQQIAVALFLDECAPLNLTPLQFVVLSALSDHGARDQASLGGLIATDRTTVQVVLGNLRKLGLVTRTKSRVDKRAKVIEITPAGRELVRVAIPLVERTQERIVAPLNRRERETLTRLLGKIADKNNLESRAPLREPRAAVRARQRSQRPANPARNLQ